MARQGATRRTRHFTPCRSIGQNNEDLGMTAVMSVAGRFPFTLNELVMSGEPIYASQQNKNYDGKKFEFQMISTK